jgi:hypothetical protein
MPKPIDGPALTVLDIREALGKVKTDGLRNIRIKVG